MNVDFAVYGDRGGAHAVRAKTFDDPVVEKTLQITDLAWGLPDHLGESPMYRGRPCGAYYILVKTIRDPEASRSGMAASVAAFFPLEEVIHESSFKNLIDLLPTPAHVPPTLSRRTLPPPAQSEPLPDAVGLRAMTSALLTRESGGPVVWVGIDSFIDVTTALWARLPPSLRRSFAFAFVCDPGDGNNRECAVVYCPEKLESRWSGQLVTNVSCQSSVPMSTAEQYVFDESVRREVNDTINDLSATVSTFADLRRACLCHETIRNLPSASNLDATKLIRNIGILSPIKERGEPLKQFAIQEICRRIESEGAVVIGLIRNIDFDVFGASKKIEEACLLGIQRNLRDRSASVKPIAQLIHESTTHHDRSWASGVIRGVTEFARSGDEQSAARIWELFEEQPSLVVQSDMLLPYKPKIDSRISATAPTAIDHELAYSLSEVAIQQSYPELYAITLSTLCSVGAAVERICDTWSADDRLASLRRLCKRVDVSDFLKCIEQSEEEKLIEVAAEVCVNEPTMLAAAFSGSCRAWRLVLCRVVELSPATIDATDKLDVEVMRSIQLLLKDGLEPQYQMCLSKTKYANLFAAENRSQLWCRLDSAALPGFLNVTARESIGQIHRGLIHSEAVEPELSDAILDNNMRTVLLPSDCDGALEKVVNVFEALPLLQEHDFEQWRQRFLTSNRNLSKVDAIVLGKFVQRRRWEYVAAKLADDVNWYGRSDLHPAVCQFLDLLSWLKRWQFGDNHLTVPPGEWWDELEKSLIGLYSEGPSSNGVWERAGGDKADLLTDGTGANQWRHSLREIRNGFQSGELSVKSLLKVVSADYANNSTVKILKETRPR